MSLFIDLKGPIYFRILFTQKANITAHVGKDSKIFNLKLLSTQKGKRNERSVGVAKNTHETKIPFPSPELHIRVRLC